MMNQADDITLKLKSMKDKGFHALLGPMTVPTINDGYHNNHANDFARLAQGDYAKKKSQRPRYGHSKK